MKTRYFISVCLIFVLIVLYLLWTHNERSFVSALNERMENSDYYADFGVIVDKDWELVCDSHPYDGPRYIKKYDRTYDPVAWADDGAWGPIFIKSNGDYFSFSGSNRDGFEFHDLGCLDRDKAKFKYDSSRKYWIPINR